MSTTSRASRTAVAAGAALWLGACLPGPWDYAPDTTPVFRGVTMTAYAVSGRPAEDVCFERLLTLTEGATDARSWFDSASVGIAGRFSNGADTLTLQPKSGAVNCFAGPATARFLTGESYTLTARIVWDSAGQRAVSSLTATARIPTEFSVRDTAYAPRAALLGVANIDLTDPTAREPVPYVDGDSVYYMAAKNSFSELSHFFRARRSPDVRAVLVTRRFDSTASRPETSFDTLLGIEPRLEDFYQNGTMNRLIVYQNEPLGGRQILDSMGFVNAWFWTGRNRIYFYGAEQIYRDYHDALQESQGNSKIRLPTNVTGGRGFFAGMVVDSFDVNIRLDGATQAFPLAVTRVAACRDKGWHDSRDCIGYYPQYCAQNDWEPADCRLDAIYRGFSGDSVFLPAALRDSARAWSARDSLLKEEAERRFCTDNNYPAEVGACAPVKAECENSQSGNGCQLLLWTRCQLAYWDLPACAEGLKSYCRARRDVHQVLCRDVPEN